MALAVPHWHIWAKTMAVIDLLHGMECHKAFAMRHRDGSSIACRGHNVFFNDSALAIGDIRKWLVGSPVGVRKLSRQMLVLPEPRDPRDA